MKIGIPRVMSYYYYYPLYKGFLEGLGAEVMVSPPTGRKTLDRLTECPTDEPCLSVKLAFPHVRYLMDAGVHRVFMPVLVRGGRQSYFCPKHTGLPAMLRNGLLLPPGYLLSPRIDIDKSRDQGRASFIAVARELGAGRKEAAAAYQQGWELQSIYKYLTTARGLTTPEAFSLIDNGEFSPSCFGKKERSFQTTGLVAHGYTMYDYTGHNIVDKLKEYGEVYTPEMVPPSLAWQYIRMLSEGEKLWSFEIQMVGSALFWLERKMVDRLIFMGPFECGPEAIIESYLEEAAERHNVPLLILTLDEQTGEAGLLTRLEAFMDTAGQRQAPLGRITPADKDNTRLPEPVRERSGLPTEVLNPPDVLNSQEDCGISPGYQYAQNHSIKDMAESGVTGGLPATAGPGYHPFAGKMVLGIPSMGNLGTVISYVFNKMGISIISPPITGQTVEKGLEIAPEFICFPMTVTIGQMRQALEKGADTLFMVSGKGRCRLGWYGNVQEILLQKAGYEFTMVQVDSPFPLQSNFRKFADSLGRISGGVSRSVLWQALLGGYRRALLLDRAENELMYIRAVEKKRGEGDRLFRKFKEELAAADGPLNPWAIYRLYRHSLEAAMQGKKHPYKVRLIGEIYAVLEEYVNMNIIKKLGSLPEHRVWVERELNTTVWFRHNIINDPRLWKRSQKIVDAAKPYLSEHVGGHGQDNVGLAALAPRENADGIIHLFPFTCMPEIIAQNALTRISAESGLPVLTIITNEQTGEAGIHTRMEAFVDIMEERRRKSIGSLLRN